MLIHKRILAVLRFATTPDDSQYFLRGYGLSPDGSVAATDGHLLLYSEKPADAPPEDFPTLETPLDASPAPSARTLPLEVADAAVRTIKKTQTLTPVLDHVAVVPADGNGHERLRIAATDLSVTYDTLVRTEGRFPDWRRILPTKAPTFTICLGAEMLIAIGRAAKTATKRYGRTGPVVTFEFTGPNDAIRLSFPCEVGKEIRGIVMPCRP